MKIQQALKHLREGEVIILIMPPENLVKGNIELIKLINKKYKRGIYITINQPYASLINLLKRNKVKYDDIFFIDLITASVTSKPKKTKNCLFVDSATSLTELGISVEQLLATIDGKKFLIVDNLGAFLIYNDEEVFLEFSHFLISKLRLYNVTAILMTVDEEDSNKLVKNIGGFCDKIIKISS